MSSEVWGVILWLSTFFITTTLAYRLGYKDGFDDVNDTSDREEEHDL